MGGPSSSESKREKEKIGSWRELNEVCRKRLSFQPLPRRISIHPFINTYAVRGTRLPIVLWVVGRPVEGATLVCIRHAHQCAGSSILNPPRVPSNSKLGVHLPVEQGAVRREGRGWTKTLPVTSVVRFVIMCFRCRYGVCSLLSPKKVTPPFSDIYFLLRHHFSLFFFWHLYYSKKSFSSFLSLR